MATTASKQTLRELVQSNRTRASADQTAAKFSESALSLITELGANTVASYHALATEPSLKMLNQTLSDQGRLLLPRVADSGLSWHRHFRDSELLLGPLGTMNSSGAEVDLEQADLVFVPALAVSLNGSRLGKGGGFYDRALEHLADVPGSRASRPILFAVVYESEILQNLPSEPHDILMHGCVTEAGYRWLI
jgi:5-formyltetrahydrofolate cyclo-ligase